MFSGSPKFKLSLCALEPALQVQAPLAASILLQPAAFRALCFFLEIFVKQCGGCGGDWRYMFYVFDMFQR